MASRYQLCACAEIAGVSVIVMCKSLQDVDRLREIVVVPWRAANIQLKLLCFIYSTVILAYPSSKSLLIP